MSSAQGSSSKQEQTITEFSDIIDITASFTLVEVAEPAADGAESTDATLEKCNPESAPTQQRPPVLRLVSPAAIPPAPKPTPLPPPARKSAPAPRSETLLPPPDMRIAALPPPLRSVAALPPPSRALPSHWSAPIPSPLPPPPRAMRPTPVPAWEIASYTDPYALPSAPPPDNWRLESRLPPAPAPSHSITPTPWVLQNASSREQDTLPPSRPRQAAPVSAIPAQAMQARDPEPTPPTPVAPAPNPALYVPIVPSEVRQPAQWRRKLEELTSFGTPAAHRIRFKLNDVGLVLAFMLAFAALGSIVALVVRAAAQPHDGAPTSGLVVTVAGPGGTMVPVAAVYADGNIACQTAPCTLSRLDPGMHFVQIIAPGFATTAPRAIIVKGSELQTVSFDLTREAGRDDPRAVQPVAAAAPIAPESLGFDIAPDARSGESEARLPRSSTASGPTTLNLNSIPISNVVLDGHPLGQTPQVGVRVSPGRHSVLFVSSEYGRVQRSVSVAAGGSQTVAVRLGP
jgi:hypothetical protein